MTLGYAPSDLTRAAIDALEGPTLLVFGANYCGHCRAAQAATAEALAGHAGLRHLKIEDGKGRPLGRSFRVKLWPTLIFLRQGKEISRLVRPTKAAEIRQALAAIDA